MLQEEGRFGFFQRLDTVVKGVIVKCDQANVQITLLVLLENLNLAFVSSRCIFFIIIIHLCIVYRKSLS